mgnify:CR=1 FL=1
MESEWKLRLHRSARKFLETLDPSQRSRVAERLNDLLTYLEKGTLPYARLDIKRLRGEWEGYLRMRVGKLRVVFRLDPESKIVYVYSVHYRRRVYG